MWRAEFCAELTKLRDRGSTVVNVLCHKSEGRWFDPSWCQWIFHWHKNTSDRTMALGSTQPLTEMSTSGISWGWRRPVRKADNLPPSCAVVTKCGNLNFLEPSGPFWASNGIALPLGTAVAQWLRCCATNWKVAGSIPAGVSGFFIDIKSFRSHYGPGVDSASNRNEHQEYFLGVKAAGA